MELGTLIIRAFKLLYMLFHRGLSHPAKTFYCYVVLLCSFYCFAAYGPCCTSGIQNPPEYDACVSFGENYELDFSDGLVSDTNVGYGIPTSHNSIESVCQNTHSFCFPSTIRGYSYQEKRMKEASLEDSSSQYNGPFGVELTQDSQQASNKSWSSDYGMFELLNGGVVSCSLNSREGTNDAPLFQTENGHKDDLSSCGGALLQQKTTQFLPKNSKMAESSFFSPNVRIGPTLLDWGQKYMYSPSVAFINVENTCNDCMLHLYEPFSTDIQFYPCNFSEISLGPGESAVISFVFFPRCLGLSSAHLVLQTSYGGFFVEAKGYATESPYGIQPLLGLEISPGGRLSRNFSLFNSFDETLYVDEITAWISVSLGHNSVETEAICSINNIHAFDNLLFPIIKDRLVVKSGQIGSPIVAVRPHRNWEVSPHSSEALLEIDISVGMEGKVFGAFCLRLMTSSQEKFDTVMVPIEAAVISDSDHDTVGIYISASLEALTPCDGGETIIIISIRNDAPYLSSFVKIVEVSDSQIFHIKYMEGLLLFPNTVTQVAIIYCSHLRTKLLDLPAKESNLRDNCKLLLLTNDSTSPQMEIQCENILHICFGDRWLSSIGLEHETKYSESRDLRAGFVARSMEGPPHVKDIETADVDELVLGNWMSQGMSVGMSVLENREVLFPVIQVGSFVPQWITVKNPSEYPVIMQLILNAGEIIGECKGPDGLVRPSSSGNLVLDESTTPTKHGFSVPKSAITKAFVHPHGRASLGPILFYPSDRCGWSGSALIRNNLSGVEWLSLRGFGGSHSLVMLEKSELVQSLDFDLEMPRHLNFSLPYALLRMKEMTSACSHSLVKELYAKNTGDLPLEVLSIRISGKECGLDGFLVQSCRGFVLEPGESTELLISYQSDFSAAMVHRDLELALATGIFLLPMKASFPHDMLSNCKKSMFWMRVKKLSLGFFLFTSLLYVVFCIICPQTTAHGSLDCLCKGDNINNIPTTVESAGKTLLRHNHRKSRLSMSDKMNNLLRSVGNDTASVGMSQRLMQTPANHTQTSQLLDAPDEAKLPSTVTQSSDTVGASQPCNNLMVKTGKEKGRRRKRKSLPAKVAGLSEVSSSQSGNSTPSSPLSPVVSATSRCNWPLSPEVEQTLEESRTSIIQEANQHSDNDQASVSADEVPVKCRGNILSSEGLLHSTPTRAASKSVEIPSATFPLPGEPSFCLALTSTVPPYARAPGSELENKKTVQAQETGHADEYTYDIWGGHFSGLHLLGPPYVTPMKSSPAENNFDSFFVNGPQTLKTISQEG